MHVASLQGLQLSNLHTEPTKVIYTPNVFAFCPITTIKFSLFYFDLY